MVGPLGHESGAVLVFGKEEFDADIAQRAYDGEHFAAGDAEGVAAAGFVQAPGDDIGGISAQFSPGLRRLTRSPPRGRAGVRGQSTITVLSFISGALAKRALPLRQTNRGAH